MGTGNNPTQDFRKTFSAAPDKDEALESRIRVTHITRSSLTTALFDQDLTYLNSLDGFESAYQINDRSWTNLVDSLPPEYERSKHSYLVEASANIAVPSNIYRESDTPKYLNLNGLRGDGQTAVARLVKGLGINIISLFPESMVELLGTENITSDLIPVLSFMQGSANGLVHAVLRTEHFDLAVFNKDMKLLNRFSAENENDILYFLVAAIEQCGLQIEDVSLSLSGNESRLDSVVPLLSRYFKGLVEPSVPSKVNVPYSFKDVKASWCWPLLNAHRCA